MPNTLKKLIFNPLPKPNINTSTHQNINTPTAIRGRCEFLALIVLSAGIFTVTQTEAQSVDTTLHIRMIDVDGYAVRVQHSNLSARREGTPLLVLEGGLTNSLDVWAPVVKQLAAIAPLVAYDRAGLGRSEWDSITPTPRHVCQRLHTLLQNIGAPPPYVLIGYSWGGVLARYYAGYYPDAVAGLVYIDPGPVITQSLSHAVAPFDSVGAGRKGFDAYWSEFASVFARATEPVRAELDVMRNLVTTEVKKRDLADPPDIPVAIVISAKPYPFFLKVDYDQQAHFEIDLRHRIRLLQEWALRSPYGTIVISNHSTHAIPREDPGVIVWSAQRVLTAAAKP